MHSRIIGFTAVMGIMSSMAFAEPAIQPGDTLESLAKARITTSVTTQVATPTAQTSVATDANADVKVEDIDPIIGDTTAEMQKVAVQTEAVAALVIKNTSTLASSEPTVSVDDIDVAHPTE